MADLPVMLTTNRIAAQERKAMKAAAKRKLPVDVQGKVVADYSGTWKMTKQGKVEVGEQWHVMFPDGSVQVFFSKKAVEKAAKAYFKKNVKEGCVGIGKIEWRT